MPRKAEHLVLLGPFRRQVGEANNAHAESISRLQIQSSDRPFE
jgi:hypothetical protein